MRHIHDRVTSQKGYDVKAMTVVLAAVIALAGCGGAASDGRSDPESDLGTSVSPGAGMPADGGLSVEEATASDVPGPLMVTGFLVAEGDEILLCDVLLESFPPQCGGASLVVEGLDLGAYETRSEGDTTWSDSPVSLLGEVQGGTLRASGTAT